MEDRLRKFACLVETGNFTRAAVALHLSQPGLTIAINKLERELGTPLLVRGSKGFSLTPAGKLAYQSAKELTVITTNLGNQIMQLAGENPNAAIGMIDSLASMIFTSPDETQKFSSLLNLSIIVNTSSYLVRAVEHDELDIAFITEQSKSLSALLAVERVGVEPLILVCRGDMRRNVEQQINHRQAQDFISYDRASTSFKLIQMSLEEQGIAIHPIFYSSSPEIMRELVLRGKGIAVLPYFLVHQLIAGGQLAVVRHSGAILVERPISSVTRHKRVLPTALASLPLLIMENLQRQASAAQELA